MTVLVEVIVSVGRKEQSRAHARVEDGVLGARADGAPPAPADVVFTVGPADAQALRDGTLDLSVGFMRGQVKMAGDFGALLRLLPATSGPDPAVPIAALL